MNNYLYINFLLFLGICCMAGYLTSWYISYRARRNALCTTDDLKEVSNCTMKYYRLELDEPLMYLVWFITYIAGLSLLGTGWKFILFMIISASALFFTAIRIKSITSKK